MHALGSASDQVLWSLSNDLRKIYLAFVFLGNPHTGELAYVWGYCYLQINAEVRQQSGINLNLITGDVDDDIPYADYMQTLWTNFAKYG